MEHQVSLSLDKTKDKEYRISCARCANETSHKVLASVEAKERKDRSYTGDDDDEWYVLWDRFEIIQCQGCKLLTARIERVDKQGWPGSDDHTIYKSLKLFPGRITGRRPLNDIGWIPSRIANIYQETYAAISNSQVILAGIGIRALVESVCRERKAKGKNLFQKIDNLVEQGVLTAQGAKFLHGLRQLGNRAAHEVKPHSNDDLLLALDILENLLTNVYIIPFRAGRLKGIEE